VLNICLKSGSPPKTDIREDRQIVQHKVSQTADCNQNYKYYEQMATTAYFRGRRDQSPNGKKKNNKYYLACAITGHQYHRKRMEYHHIAHTERSVTIKRAMI